VAAVENLVLVVVTLAVVEAAEVVSSLNQPIKFYLVKIIL
tara:strand:+ start:591 stop:710 length:120 start_codon:yes stop_codon:yes gene_type:complete